MPCCKRAMPKPRGGTPELKLAQDIAKAERSIELLDRIQHDPNWDVSRPESFYEAMQSEARRLKNAIQNPEKLWTIYRRADKGCSLRGEVEMTLESRIVKYLQAGGLFNPEHMEHDKVRDLLFDCRDALAEHSLAPATPTDCKFCKEGMWPLKRYLDGRLMHFDGMMAWYSCATHTKPAAPPATQTGDVRKALAELADATEDLLNTMLNSRTYRQRERVANAIEAARSLLAASAAPTPEPTGADEKLKEMATEWIDRGLAMEQIAKRYAPKRKSVLIDKAAIYKELGNQVVNTLAAQPGQKGERK